jgi:hypothetical protein
VPAGAKDLSELRLISAKLLQSRAGFSASILVWTTKSNALKENPCRGQCHLAGNFYVSQAPKVATIAILAIYRMDE